MSLPKVSLDDLKTGLRLLRDLPPLFRRPIDLSEARKELRTRLTNRDSGFLSVLRGEVFSRASSPYRRLLSHAGCELGDIEQLLRTSGLENTLQVLRTRGIYLTTSEYKSRTPVIRGSLRFEMNTSDLESSVRSDDFPVMSSGSRGGKTGVTLDMDDIRIQFAFRAMGFVARGDRGWHHAIWTIPGGTELVGTLQLGMTGRPPKRRFVMVDYDAPELDPHYRWGSMAVRLAGRLANIEIPAPTVVPVGSPEPIVDWLADVLASGNVPHLETSSSAAVRICRAAAESGVLLTGAQFTIGGEPVTQARLDEIRRVGAVAVPRYTFVEAGRVGYGCLAPIAPDDVHMATDIVAIIQSSDGTSNPTGPGDLFLTSLDPRARLLLINVSVGDQGIVTQRDCGCPMAELGWDTHLHSIRSNEKATAGGMTMSDVQVSSILEDHLPALFGGGPGHYQLIESQARDGTPKLELLVDPVVGPLDEQAVAEAFLQALAEGKGTSHLMGTVWRDAAFLTVVRQAPRMTGGRKVLHLIADR